MNQTTINAVAEAIDTLAEAKENLYVAKCWAVTEKDRNAQLLVAAESEKSVWDIAYRRANIKSLSYILGFLHSHPLNENPAIEAYEKQQTAHVCIHSPEQCKQTVREMTVEEVVRVLHPFFQQHDRSWVNIEDAAQALAKLGTIRIVGGGE